LTDTKNEFVEYFKFLLGDQRRKARWHRFPFGWLYSIVEILFLHHYSNGRDSIEMVLKGKSGQLEQTACYRNGAEPLCH